MGGAPNHPKLDNFGIETHGFGDPVFQETPKYDQFSGLQQSTDSRHEFRVPIFYILLLSTFTPYFLFDLR